MPDVRKLPQLKPMTEKDPEKAPVLERICDFLFMGKRGIFFFVAAVLILYLLFCAAAERALKNGVYNIMREIGSNGFGVSYTTALSYRDLTSGLYIDDFVLTAPEAMGGWTLKTGRLSISAFPFSNKIFLRFDGTHSLTVRNIGDIRLVVGRGEIVYEKPVGSKPFAVRISLGGMTAAAPKSMTGFAVPSLDASLAPEGETAFSFDVKAGNATLPAYLSQHLPESVEYLLLRGKLTGFSEKREKPLWTDWTDNGGLVELERGELIWKPFMAQTSGTVAFDAAYKMSAALTARLYGFFDLLDALEAGSYLHGAQVSLAKVVLGENLKKEDGEAIESLTTPVSFQNGLFYAGPVRIY